MVDEYLLLTLINAAVSFIWLTNSDSLFFSSFTEQVGPFRAKWEPESLEVQQTQFSFHFSHSLRAFNRDLPRVSVDLSPIVEG